MKTLIVSLLAGLAVLNSGLIIQNFSRADSQNFDDKSKALSIIYGEQSGNRYNIYQREEGNDPSLLYTYDGNLVNYQLSNDQHGIALNMGDALYYYDIENRRSKTLYNSNGRIDGMAFSPDNSKMFITDRDDHKGSSQYGFHAYDLTNSKDTARFSTNDYHFRPNVWRADGLIILSDMRKDDQGYTWIYDSNNGNLRKTSFHNPGWIAEDGMYMALPNKGTVYHNYPSYNYNPVDNYASNYYDDGFRIVNPVSGADYGSYNTNGYTNMMGYSPLNNQIIYRDYSQGQRSGYYVSGVAKVQSVSISNPYDILNSWNNYNLGAQSQSLNGQYLISMGQQPLVTSNNPMVIFFQFYAVQNSNYSNYQNPSQYPTSSISLQTVDIQSFSFQPSDITIPAGSTVTWNNLDSAPHTVTSRDGYFDSNVIPSGGQYSMQFSGPGDYMYYCKIHPSMHGVIHVR